MVVLTKTTIVIVITLVWLCCVAWKYRGERCGQMVAKLIGHMMHNCVQDLYFLKGMGSKAKMCFVKTKTYQMISSK